MENKSGFKSVDFSNVKERVVEHYSLDTPLAKLKGMEMEEVVLKLERDVDSHEAQITCKYKVLGMKNIFLLTTNFSGIR